MRRIHACPRRPDPCGRAQRTAHRVVDLDLKVPALLRQQACHIIGAGEAPREHDGDDAVIALVPDAVKGRRDVLPRGKGGLGQLARPEPGIDIGGMDIHAVGIFAVGTADPQGNDVDVVLLRDLSRQIGGGIGEQGNFTRRHRGDHLHLLTGLPPQLIIGSHNIVMP